MKSLENNYYDIAINNLRYTEDSFNLGYYNPISSQLMHVSELALKSVLEMVDTNVESLLKSHNLKAIYYRIHSIDETFTLNVKDLSYLTDFYFDARYPGDNFLSVTEEQCLECAKITYDVLDCVNAFRLQEQLPTYQISRKILNSDSPNSPQKMEF